MIRTPSTSRADQLRCAAHWRATGHGCPGVGRSRACGDLPAEELLASLRAETTTAIKDIRGLVYAMRPTALDELGLVLALRQQAGSLRSRAGDPVRVDITAPDDLPALPAAVEVAACRIVVEALANVARHTTSTTATVRVSAPAHQLDSTVIDAGTDAGTGRDSCRRPGVDLVSMRERAAELGGDLSAGPASGGGGRVTARLPLRGHAS